MTGAATGSSSHQGAARGDGSRGHGAGLAGRLTAYWLSPPGLVIGCATLLALIIRGFLLSRPHFLTSGAIEYDDGVYLGEAIRLLHGDLPYRDYALIQPPGIVVLALPAAVIAKLAGATAGLAVARLATVAASAACVALAGNLIRHRGTLATLVTCGLLAVYPADIMAARTLLLEPWMNLCALVAATIAFRDGRLAASPRRLALAGLLLGYAGTVKFWAVVPAAMLFFACCCVPAGREPRDTRARRAGWYLPAVAAGFAVPVAALSWVSPVTFFRGTLLYQATRTGQPAPLALRLDHLTGLIPVLDGGGLGLSPHSFTLFQADSTATMEATSFPPAATYVITAVLAALVIAGYARGLRARTHLEWFALGTATAACGAILGYSAFFYHYPAFPAPWLAICAGAAAAAVRLPTPRAVRAAVSAACAVIAAIAVLEIVQMTGMAVRANPPLASLIPQGACVVTDQVAVTIAADRFTPADPGCPDVVDALAQTLVLSHGVSPQGGAGARPGVVEGWQAIFSKAQYVVLTSGHANRIPWTPQLDAWFHARFRQVAVYRRYANARLYQRAG
jgi:hypothetical protein